MPRRVIGGPPACVQAVCLMVFAIQWTGPEGPANAQRDTPVEAIRYAIQMLGKGYGDVMIIGPDGKAYPPPEFAKFYSDTK
jgi:hypothetical protein